MADPSGAASFLNSRKIEAPSGLFLYGQQPGQYCYLLYRPDRASDAQALWREFTESNDAEIQVVVEQSSSYEGEDLGADDEVSFIIDPSPWEADVLENRLEATKELANKASASDFLGIPVLDIPDIEVSSPEDFCLCRGSSKGITPR